MIAYERNNDEIVTLYHGSKSGIHGAIAPLSREHCDFGKGFYMGTDRNQSLTLICNYPKAKIYTLNVDLSQLKLLDMEAGLDWALLVAYHRGKMESIKNTKIYERYANLSKGYDMISGMIANDRMVMANEICRKYRREGRFFDEILEEGE